MNIIERNTNNVTIRMSNSRWNRILALEKMYKMAKSVVKAKKECEDKESMTVAEAKHFLSALFMKN